MEISSNIKNRYAAAEKKDEGKSIVKIEEFYYEDAGNFNVEARVDDIEENQKYKVEISLQENNIKEESCGCSKSKYSNAGCEHLQAVVEQLQKEGKAVASEKYISKIKQLTYNLFTQVYEEFYGEELKEIDNLNKPKSEKVRIEPEISYSEQDEEMKISFLIGNKQMYKIKDISRFYEMCTTGKDDMYGDKLVVSHKDENFYEESIPYLTFLKKYGEMILYMNKKLGSIRSYYGKKISISNVGLTGSVLDDVFEIQEKNNYKTDIFKTENIKVKMQLKKINDEKYILAINNDDFQIIEGGKNIYIYQDEAIYKCSKQVENTVIKLINIFKKNYVNQMFISKQQLGALYNVVLKEQEEFIELRGVEQEEIEKYKVEKLATKVFLDYDKNGYLILEMKFCYGETEINPLKESKIQIARDTLQETKNLNVLIKSGFMADVKKGIFVIPKDEQIYGFLSNDIEYYMKKYEVLVTDVFKKKEIKRPKMGSIGVRVENDLLLLDLKNIEIDLVELQEIMMKYREKKRFHKLRDGSYLDLSENQEIEFLDKALEGMELKYEELEKGEIAIPVQRSLYLNQILKELKGTEVIKNEAYKKIVAEFDKDALEDEMQVPESLEKILRFYQKTGYKWLKVLDKYKFGGILADDMGLGKTVQILSVIKQYLESVDEKEKKTSLVICPSSLVLNWQSEIEKFTTGIKTVAITGTSEERKKYIENIEQYDVVIISYDLLKRDIEEYIKKDYCYRFIIADEAQYLKNSKTQNAKAIKQIKSVTRYALTGTPIENSLAELWSIFDFVMPGYLFTYKSFKQEYEIPIVKEEDRRAMRKLKMLIEPFVLRRTKKQVLTELPDKTITVLNNEMEKEQKDIYLAQMLDAKHQLNEVFQQNGFEKSKMQILAALTRLRQICCHPSLYIENYKGGSSKLEQCMEIIDEGIEGGHKILLFSGYTSMFGIIEEELKQKNVKYFKLTGETKVDKRIEMVNEFNENSDVKVFLISLKAGGTGLNLTGADMVIHYDPWWNVSVENQATDRAYRIGQKNNVQVYKLITKDSIEEKINELQQRKANLMDNVLDINVSFVNQMSKDEILNLFS